MAFDHSSEGSYFQNVNQKWIKQATVLKQGQKLVLQFTTGCSAELQKQTDGSLMGSCTVGTGHRQVLYTAQLKLQGQCYQLYYKMLNLGDAELSNDQIFIAIQKR